MRKATNDYIHKLCRDNILRTRQQQNIRSAARHRIAVNSAKHRKLTHL